MCHAQVVQFYSHQASLPAHKFPYRLNSLLPYDIRVVSLHKTAPDFHVTCSAHAKVRKPRVFSCLDGMCTYYMYFAHISVAINMSLHILHELQITSALCGSDTSNVGYMPAPAINL